MAQLLEPNYYGLWGTRQPAGRGTPLGPTAVHRRLTQVAGDIAASVDPGDELFSDLSKYPAHTEFVNTVSGQGEPALEGRPSDIAWLLWLLHGAETVTAVPLVNGPPYRLAHSLHEFAPAVGQRPHWATFHRRTGSGVIQRHGFGDSIVSRVVLEGSTAAKVLRVTPRILSLDPGIFRDADPSQGFPAARPFRYTDGSGAYIIDGQVFRGQTQFSITIDEAYELVYGDDERPFDIVQGTPTATVAATVLFDTDTLARWNMLLYGTVTPANGARPQERLPDLGSYVTTLRQEEPEVDQAGGTGPQQFKFDGPRVRWTLPPAPAPNVAGGATEVTLAGSLRSPVGASSAAYAIGMQLPTTVAAFNLV